MRISTKVLPILERLPSDLAADMCFVTVRREQIESVLPDLAGATSIPRVVFLMNHANGSDNPLTFFEPSRIVLAFPGMAGYRETSIIRYLDIPQQHTVVEERAQDVVSLFRDAGFAVEAVRDMDAWMISLSTPGRLSQSHCPAQANTEIEGAPAGAVTGVVV
jgi:ketopantoate reductase